MDTMTVQIGIIGGSGLYDMAELTDREERTLVDAVRRSVRSVRDRHAARASAWRFWRATAPATGSCRRS